MTSNKLIITPEIIRELDKNPNQFLGVSQMTPKEYAKLDSTTQEVYREYALIKRIILVDDPISFGYFFELAQGSPMHGEQAKWTDSIYKAHSEGKGVLHECFRESGKSIFSKYFLAYRIGKEPHKRSCIIRINDPKANEITDAVAHIIAHDPIWKLIYPNIIPDEKAGWGAHGYNVRDTTNKEWERLLTKEPTGSTFIGYGYESGSIIGSHFDGVGIVDDIHDRKNTMSETKLAEVKGFYKDTWTYCLMKGAWEIFNFTPWTLNDLYMYLKSLNIYYHSKSPAIIPAEEGEEGAELWEKNPDIPLSGSYYKFTCPQLINYAKLEDEYIKTGPIEFARMMLLDLSATRGLTLKLEWLHEYPFDQIKNTWPVIMGIDYASTVDKLKDKDRDYFALAIMRAIPGGGIVLVDGIRAKVSKGEALDITMNYWQKYLPTQKIGVESIGKGEEFYNDLNLLQDANGKIPPLMKITHGRTSKGERFEKWLAPRCMMSRIWISNEEHPFINRFKDEWAMYGGALDHDDCLDAVYMAAIAAEGFMPSTAERTFERKAKQDDSFVRALGGR